MKKFLKWTAIIVGSMVVILFGLFKYMQYKTKKASPEAVAEYSKGDKKITVVYSRPSKKGRIIFDSLVPYGKVWRTGANEATTFETNYDLEIGGKKLPAGKYTLWTIPAKDVWTVIFNGKQYGWGVNFDTEAAREPEADVLQVIVPVETLGNPVEQFTIFFEDSGTTSMVLEWDRIMVKVPIK